MQNPKTSHANDLVLQIILKIIVINYYYWYWYTAVYGIHIMVKMAHTLIDGGPLECESSAIADELFSSTTITS